MSEILQGALPYTLAAVFGLLLGSFANVVIWRVPRGESLVSPGSHCPICGRPVHWRDNVPVLSWLALKGRCRECGVRISLRYPLVEALSASLWVAGILAFGPSVRGAVASVFLWTLMVLTFIDLDTMRLPNPIVASLAGFGVVSVLASQFTGVVAAPLVGEWSSPLMRALLGVALGAGLSGSVAAAYAALRGRSGFGMGDVKLLGAMGVFLGPYVLLALLIGSMTGAVAGVVAAGRAGEGFGTKIPFGPFLALGGVGTLLWGPQLLAWYTSLVGIA